MLRISTRAAQSATSTKSSQVWLRRKRQKIALPRDEGPNQLRTFQDLPEYRDRVSIMHEQKQPFIPVTYNPQYINKQLDTPDKFDTAITKQWKQNMENDAGELIGFQCFPSNTF